MEVFEGSHSPAAPSRRQRSCLSRQRWDLAFQAVLGAATFYSLFGDDVRTALPHSISLDTTFFALSLTTTVLFGVEMAYQMVTRGNRYLGLPRIATQLPSQWAAALPPFPKDLLWLLDSSRSSGSSGQVADASADILRSPSGIAGAAGAAASSGPLSGGSTVGLGLASGSQVRGASSTHEFTGVGSMLFSGGTYEDMSKSSSQQLAAAASMHGLARGRRRKCCAAASPGALARINAVGEALGTATLWVVNALLSLFLALALVAHPRVLLWATKCLYHVFGAGSFFFWLDAAAIVSCAFETASAGYDAGISPHSVIYLDNVSGIHLARAGRASRAGVRIARIASRIDVAVLGAALSDAASAIVQALQRSCSRARCQRSRVAGVGSREGHDSGREASSGSAKPRAPRAQLVRNTGDTRVGAELTDLMTRRVIVGVLLLILVPPYLVHSPPEDAGETLLLEAVHAAEVAATGAALAAQAHTSSRGLLAAGSVTSYLPSWDVLAGRNDPVLAAATAAVAGGCGDGGLLLASAASGAAALGQLVASAQADAAGRRAAALASRPNLLLVSSGNATAACGAGAASLAPFGSVSATAPGVDTSLGLRESDASHQRLSSVSVVSSYLVVVSGAPSGGGARALAGQYLLTAATSPTTHAAGLAFPSDPTVSTLSTFVLEALGGTTGTTSLPASAWGPGTGATAPGVTGLTCPTALVASPATNASQVAAALSTTASGVACAGIGGGSSSCPWWGAAPAWLPGAVLSRLAPAHNAVRTNPVPACAKAPPGLSWPLPQSLPQQSALATWTLPAGAFTPCVAAAFPACTAAAGSSATSTDVTVSLYGPLSPPVASTTSTLLIFDTQADSKVISYWSIGLTLLVVAVLASGAGVFSWVVNSIVLRPLGAMTVQVRAISEDPLRQASFDGPPGGTGGGVKGALEGGSGTSRPAVALTTSSHETSQLIRTLANVASLLRMGLGPVGRSLLSAALRRNPTGNAREFHTLTPGSVARRVLLCVDLCPGLLESLRASGPLNGAGQLLGGAAVPLLNSLVAACHEVIIAHGGSVLSHGMGWDAPLRGGGAPASAACGDGAAPGMCLWASWAVPEPLGYDPYSGSLDDASQGSVVAPEAALAELALMAAVRLQLLVAVRCREILAADASAATAAGGASGRTPLAGAGSGSDALFNPLSTVGRVAGQLLAARLRALQAIPPAAPGPDRSTGSGSSTNPFVAYLTERCYGKPAVSGGPAPHQPLAACALHVCEVVQGVVGSTSKIDAAVWGPHASLLPRVLAAARATAGGGHSGSSAWSGSVDTIGSVLLAPPSVLMTAPFRRLLTPAAARVTRAVDCVPMVKTEAVWPSTDACSSAAALLAAATGPGGSGTSASSASGGGSAWAVDDPSFEPWLSTQRRHDPPDTAAAKAKARRAAVAAKAAKAAAAGEAPAAESAAMSPARSPAPSTPAATPAPATSASAERDSQGHPASWASVSSAATEEAQSAAAVVVHAKAVLRGVLARARVASGDSDPSLFGISFSTVHDAFKGAGATILTDEDTSGSALSSHRHADASAPTPEALLYSYDVDPYLIQTLCLSKSYPYPDLASNEALRGKADAATATGLLHAAVLEAAVAAAATPGGIPRGGVSLMSAGSLSLPLGSSNSALMIGSASSGSMSASAAAGGADAAAQSRRRFKASGPAPSFIFRGGEALSSLAMGRDSGAAPVSMTSGSNEGDSGREAGHGVVAPSLVSLFEAPRSAAGEAAGHELSLSVSANGRRSRDARGQQQLTIATAAPSSGSSSTSASKSHLLSPDDVADLVALYLGPSLSAPALHHQQQQQQQRAASTVSDVVATALAAWDATDPAAEELVVGTGEPADPASSFASAAAAHAREWRASLACPAATASLRGGNWVDGRSPFGEPPVTPSSSSRGAPTVPSGGGLADHVDSALSMARRHVTRNVRSALSEAVAVAAAALHSVAVGSLAGGGGAYDPWEAHDAVPFLPHPATASGGGGGAAAEAASLSEIAAATKRTLLVAAGLLTLTVRRYPYLPEEGVEELVEALTQSSDGSSSPGKARALGALLRLTAAGVVLLVGGGHALPTRLPDGATLPPPHGHEAAAEAGGSRGGPRALLTPASVAAVTDALAVAQGRRALLLAVGGACAFTAALHKAAAGAAPPSPLAEAAALDASRVCCAIMQVGAVLLQV